jgi:hypothetical protein
VVVFENIQTIILHTFVGYHKMGFIYIMLTNEVFHEWKNHNKTIDGQS